VVVNDFLHGRGQDFGTGLPYVYPASPSTHPKIYTNH